MKTPTASRLKSMDKENESQGNFYSPTIDKTKEKLPTTTKEEPTLLFVNEYFYVTGYSKKLTSMILQNIEYFNGQIVEQPDGCTYFVTPFEHDINGEEFKFKSNEFKFCTIQYIDSCINSKEIIDIESNIIFKPMKTVEGILEMKNLKISITQFLSSERDDMIYLIKRSGAIYSADLKDTVNVLIAMEYVSIYNKYF